MYIIDYDWKMLKEKFIYKLKSFLKNKNKIHEKCSPGSSPLVLTIQNLVFMILKP